MKPCDILVLFEPDHTITTLPAECLTLYERKYKLHLESKLNLWIFNQLLLWLVRNFNQLSDEAFSTINGLPDGVTRGQTPIE